MLCTFALALSTTKVFRKKLNQSSLSTPSPGGICNGSSISNLMEEFCGVFLTTALTWYGENTLSAFSIIIFPTASVVPNCFFAMSSEITTEYGSFKHALRLPFIRGNEKMEKKPESTYSKSCG